MHKFVLFALATFFALLISTPLTGGGVPTATAAGTDEVSEAATPAHVNLLARFRGDPMRAHSSNGTSQVLPRGPRLLPFRGAIDLNGVTANPADIPVVEDSPVVGRQPEGVGTLLENINGMSDKDQAANNGGSIFDVTPPDQGLCVGLNSSSQKVIYELVNMGITEYDANGDLIGSNSLANFFGDPNAFSDPRCFYDATTNAWFFTLISSGGVPVHTSTDIEVVNSSGAVAVYNIDTSIGGACFGDQPHVGYDNNNLYLSHDEFCGFNFGTYSGADLWAISKANLVNEVSGPNVHAAWWGPRVLSGIPVLTLEPAVSPGATTEFLLNSFPQGKTGKPLATYNHLGLWRVDGGANVSTGNYSKVKLTGSLISSETYANPKAALSTGDGTCNNIGGTFVCSEKSIQPDDDRAMQVQQITEGGKPFLYMALSSAVKVKGDVTTRDGAAWFKINANVKTVAAQGFLGSAGKYILYPAIEKTHFGTTAMVFSITSPTLNPSAAYAVLGKGTTWGAINLAATGSGAHLSFANPINGNQFRPRWGDYSAAALDPDGHDIWLATEYIPPVSSQDIYDNWGTSVVEVQGK